MRPTIIIRNRLWPVAAILTVLAVFSLAATACGGDDNSARTATPKASNSAAADEGWEGAIVTPPIQKPRAVLTDTSGNPFDLQKDTQGYVTLLYVGYTHCPDVCPAHMADLATAMKKMSPDVLSKVKVVFVTADPDRDTGPVLRKWLDLFNKDFIGLTGTQQQVDDFQRSIGIQPATREDLGNGNYAVNHAAFIIAFGTENVAHLVYPSGITVDTWVHDLPKLVKEGWKS
ncbi:MAG: SCO family protein [Dehalococcoidia bacterium]|nr:SCO family protein [Dehalococcoidia bacterium]